MNDSLAITSTTGIDLKLAIAGPGSRAYAFVIDWHIRLLLALAWFIAASFITTGALTWLESSDAGYATYVFATILPALAIYFLYHPVLELLMRGRTPGKRMAGVRIVTLSGEEPGALALLIRNILRILDSMPLAYVLGLMTTLFTAHAVRIGDLAAGTVLVYSEDRDVNKTSVEFSQASVQQYGLQRVELAADLLERWDQLNEAKRSQLGRQMLGNLDPELISFANNARPNDIRERLLSLIQG